MKIKDIIYFVIQEYPDLELAKFLHDEKISRNKLLIFFQELEALSEIDLSVYYTFVKTCPDEKLFDLYAYLAYYIIKSEIKRSKDYMEYLLKKDSI